MSWKAVEWAKGWTTEELSPPEAFVLFLIAEHYNEKEHRAWPKVSTLIKLTRYSRRTVQRAIDGLEEKGLALREPWVSERGATLTTRYCLPHYDERSQPREFGRRVRQQFGPAGEWETEDLEPKPEPAPEEWDFSDAFPLSTGAPQ